MSTTIQDLVKTLSPPQPNTEAVRRTKNSYALNGEDVCALSLSDREDIDTLVLDASAAALEHLYLNDNKNLRHIRIEVPLPRLRHLYLSRCALVSLDIPAGCTALEQIYVSNNQLTTLTFRGDCPQLQLLDASKNQLTEFRLQEGFAKLAYVYLRDNQLQNLQLEAALPDLNILHLRNNKLDELPAMLLQSPRMEALYLHNNPLNRFDKNVIETGEDASSWEGVRNYLSSLADGEAENDQVKLIVLGNSTAGKSSLIYFLKDGDYQYNRDSTHGMVPLLWEIEDKFKVAIWDFGGQEYYHNIHHLFFTNKALYVVLFDEKTNKQGFQHTQIQVYDQGEKVSVTEKLEHFHYDYWLDNIRYLLQSDAAEAQNHDRFLIQNKIETAEKEPDKSADFNISVEKSYEKNEDYLFAFEDFRRKFLKKLREIKGATPVSTKWLQIKNDIQQEAQSGKPWLEKEDYVATAEKVKSGISQRSEKQQESELDTLTKTLERTGVILYYPDIPSVKNKIFINPEWLTDSIYRVLDYKVQREKGRFAMAHVEDAIREKQVNGKAIKAVGLTAEEIIDLMRDFELIFEINPALNKTSEPIYVAPQYLPSDCPEPGRIDALKEDVLRNAAPTFSLKYPTFMPKSTMPRFISRRGHFSRYPCWKYGIQFVLEATEILVECDFDQKLIHVWIDDKPKKKELSKQIFDDFQEINDKNPEIQITKNQENWLKIGKLLRHDSPKWGNVIESEEGEPMDFANFSEFTDHSKSHLEAPIKKIFISCAPEDLEHLEEMEKQLFLWKRNQLISVWTEKELTGGEENERIIESKLEEADVILFLCSTDLFATERIFDKQIKRALQRLNDPADTVTVVPIIIRSCFLEETPLATLNSLNIHDRPNKDEAWTEAGKYLKKIIF